ncbi:PREDICTED: enolase-like [Rhagoletis zephyria]|uniref:enolase-like n=1 Tax=Rhagoletis zephyria TaxID=28612 RepID=UPI0008114F96|nr:PREDICTED: enolase-like [Rhagoletis zephyria]
MPIKQIHARQIFDSRGNPTIEVDVTTNLGLFRAAVPSGASTGTYEALELRDGDKNKYHGKSVYKAISNINDILRPKIIAKNFEVTQQKEIDNFMIALDGTDFKSNLGANSILGISIAVAKAGAAKKGVPLYRHLADLAGNRNFILPVPGFNVINGGQHAGNRMAVQEFMIMPTGAISFAEAMQMGSEVYHHLLAVIKRKYGLDATCVGDEGGFAPNITDAGEALELINQSIKLAGLVGKVEIAIDSAASEMYKEGLYDLDFKNVKSEKAKWLTPTSLIDFYKKLIADYPIVSLEDPLNQDDEWDTWAQLTKSVSIQIVGDDLTVTNPKRIQTAIEEKACNGLLLKINQIGTITEAIKAHNLVKAHGWGTMVSHRSGDTEDDFIADLVVGLGTGQIKAGAPCRSERLAKYNQLLRIEEQLGKDAKYAGKNFRKPY